MKNSPSSMLLKEVFDSSGSWLYVAKLSLASYRTDPRHRVIETGLAYCLSNCGAEQVVAKLAEKGPSLIGRFRGPDHLRGPKQGSDRLKLIKSCSNHPGFGRIGRVVRLLLRHIYCVIRANEKNFCQVRFLFKNVLAWYVFRPCIRTSHTTVRTHPILPVRTIPCSSVVQLYYVAS
jgi:hypothetical protein